MSDWQSSYIGVGMSDSTSWDMDGGMTRTHTEDGHTTSVSYGYADGVTEVPAWTVTKEWDFAVEVSDPLGQVTMTIPLKPRISGCWHLRQYSNGETQWDEDPDDDYLHICRLKEHIAMLESLLRFRKAYQKGQVGAGCIHAYLKTTTVDGVVTESRCQTCGEFMV